MKEQFKQAAVEIGIQVVVMACSKVIEIMTQAHVHKTTELPTQVLSTQSKEVI